MTRLAVLLSILAIAASSWAVAPPASSSGPPPPIGHVPLEADATRPLVRSTRWLMGTYLHMVIADSTLGEERERAAMEAAFAEVERWNSLLSNYDRTTPLSRINRSAGTWVTIPVDLFVYLERARHDAARTEGVFDITMGGWLAARGDLRPPIGPHLLQLAREEDQATARLVHAGMALDPGGNGKGVALDAAAAILRTRGVRHALLDFGGSSWIGLGRPPEGEAWQVNVARGSGKVAGTLRLEDRALSISASLVRETGPGVSSPREPHILDPRTGSLVEMDRVVAVVSPSATDAEVLSTALVVAGETGLPWLENFENADAVILDEGQPPILSPGAHRWFTTP